jgi:hypothetical protein
MKHTLVCALIVFGCLAVTPARAGGAMPEVCKDCPPPNHYDSQEVVKHVREVDQSRTVHTTTMAPLPPADNDNGIYIRPDVTLVNIVVHKYRVIETPGLVPATAAPAPRPVLRTHCKRSRRHARYDSCGPALRVRD